ncbi:MFS transporter [Spirillospora sp. CA-253888]
MSESVKGSPLISPGKGREPGAPALLAVCLGFFMVLLDASALNVSLPRIQEEFDTTLSGLEWTVNGYAIAMAACLMGGGAIGDKWGPRRVFLLSQALFVLSSVACAASPGLGALVAARIVQGIAAGGLLPASLAVIAHLYRDEAARARALTVWGGVSSLALVLGPVVGGALTSAAGWRSIFLINLPVGLLAVVLTLRHVPPSPVRAARLDLAGQLTVALAVGCGVGALIEGGAAGWTRPLTLALIGGTLLSAAAFPLVEARAANPVVPLDLFRNTRFLAGLTLGALFQYGAYGAQFVLSLHLQNVWGLDALGAGLSFVPFAVTWTIASFWLARLVTRTGPRPLVLAGSSIAALGACVLAATPDHRNWWILIAGSCLLGLGAGLMGPSLPALALGALPPARSGLASGALNAFRQIGGAVGVALFGALVANTARGTGLRLSLALVAVGFVACLPVVVRGLAARPR